MQQAANPFRRQSLQLGVTSRPFIGLVIPLDLAEDARAAISERNVVAPVTLGHRSAYANAWIDGRSVEEYDPKGKAADEIRALYTWMMTM